MVEEEEDPFNILGDAPSQSKVVQRSNTNRSFKTSKVSRKQEHDPFAMDNVEKSSPIQEPVEDLFMVDIADFYFSDIL